MYSEVPANVVGRTLLSAQGVPRNKYQGNKINVNFTTSGDLDTVKDCSQRQRTRVSTLHIPTFATSPTPNSHLTRG